MDNLDEYRIPLNNWQVAKTSPVLEEYVVYHDLPEGDCGYDPFDNEYHNSRESAEARAAVLNSLDLFFMYDSPEEIAKKIVEKMDHERETPH